MPHYRAKPQVGHGVESMTGEMLIVLGHPEQMGSCFSELPCSHLFFVLLIDLGMDT
jgi:hypothetical protein